MKILCSFTQLQRTKTLGIALNDQQYLIVLHDGSIYAYLNRCPHLAIPLEWQENQFLDKDTSLIRCSTHGALFLPSTGECVSGPCVGDALTPIAIQQQGDAIVLAET
jgi:nitrite reductase/ring-hydroxylating ferredoxin subunit